MNFKEEIGRKTEQIEHMIGRYLPVEEGYQKTVLQAMNYSITAGGKRLRPLLMAESAALFTETDEIWRLEECGLQDGNLAEQTVLGRALSLFMAALEMIHNYSLVHDDLPAMDNDEYRRGRKTTHVVYGEGMAILAGDGLLNYAFETAALAFEGAETMEEYRRIAQSMQILGRKAGIYGMIGGQCADLEAEKMDGDVSEEMLFYIHEHKTAALIQAAMTIGATLAGAGREAIENLEKCAYNIGIAFQIQDDILDVTATTKQLGKPVFSDEKNQKTTYVTLEGIDKAREDAEKFSNRAIALLHELPGENPFLEELIRMLITREK